MKGEETAKTGIILIQLGAPASAQEGDIRRFLREFLLDQRVVDSPRWWWVPLLYGVISVKRPKRLAPMYEKIQIPGHGMPLFYHTRRLAEGVAEKFSQRGVLVGYAMRYGQPSLPQLVRQFYQTGVERLLLFPLFPQYSGTTTASCNALFHTTLADLPLTPASRIAAPYFNHPAYLDALARSIAPSLSCHPDALLLISFHGLPQRYVDKGDPYAGQCEITARLLAQRLDLPAHGWQMSYQSRFGKEQWLLPATDRVLAQLPSQGHDKVILVTPGFAADCLETLEEIAHTGKQTFLAAGGRHYYTLPCLNSESVWVEALCAILAAEMAGW